MKQFLLLLAIVFFHENICGQVKQIQPFTGAMTIENGIRYDKLEITIDDYLLLIPDIPLNKELVIKITKPWSFTADAAGNVHPGVGFKIADNNGKIIAQTVNIYKDNKEGFDQNSLSALSLSITLDEKMKINDSITIYTKFFDEMNNDSLLVILPCRVVAKGQEKVINGWNSFSSTYGATGMFVNCKAEEFHMNKTYLNKETETSVDTILLSVKSIENFAMKNDKFFLNARYILYNKEFNIIETRPLFTDGQEGLSPTLLQNIKRYFILPAGFHRGIARILIQDENSTGKLDAVLSFAY